MPDKEIWELIDSLKVKTNCEDKQVACVIYDHFAKEIVGQACNLHEDQTCDCNNTKTAKHAEIRAMAKIEKKRLRSHLIAFVNHKPCDNCGKALDKVVGEVRYRSQH